MVFQSFLGKRVSKEIALITYAFECKKEHCLSTETGQESSHKFCAFGYRVR